MRIAHEDPPPLRRIAPQIPRDLATIVQKAISKEPAQRFQTAEKLADDLQRFLDNKPIHARPIAVWEHVSMWARRNPAVAALSLMFGISLVLALLLVSWLWQRAESDKNMAMRATAERQASAAKAEATSKALAEMILTGSPYESGSYTVHQMLIDYEPQLISSLAEYPELEARLRGAIGFVLASRSQLNVAESNLKHAVRLIEEAGQGKSHLAADIRERLANVYQRKRNDDEACRQLKKVLEIRTELLGPDHVKTMQSRVLWLATLREVSEMVLTEDEILAGLDDAAAAVIGRSVDPECAEIFLQARFYAITVANRLGRFDVSERYCRERLTLQKQIHVDQPNHPAIVSTLQHMAEVTRLKGEFDASLELIGNAQELCRDWFGHTNTIAPQEIDLLIDVVKTHQAAGDFFKMESSARHALNLAKENLEQDHPYINDSAKFLADSLDRLGRLDESIMLRKALTTEAASTAD